MMKQKKNSFFLQLLNNNTFFVVCGGGSLRGDVVLYNLDGGIKQNNKLKKQIACAHQSLAYSINKLFAILEFFLIFESK